MAVAKQFFRDYARLRVRAHHEQDTRNIHSRHDARAGRVSLATRVSESVTVLFLVLGREEQGAETSAPTVVL